MKNITLTYYGHSCFTIEADNYVIALDPYDENVKGYKKLELEANEVLCSHKHQDHCYKQAVKIIDSDKANPFNITEIESYHDDVKGVLRGKNTIRIFECDGIKVCHFGDIGCNPTEKQKTLLKDLDVALVPVGGHYTLEPNKVYDLLTELNPKMIIPMHYRLNDLGFDVIKELKDFTKYYNDVNYCESNSLTINSKELKGVTVLTYQK